MMHILCQEGRDWWASSAPERKAQSAARSAPPQPSGPRSPARARPSCAAARARRRRGAAGGGGTPQRARLARRRRRRRAGGLRSPEATSQILMRRRETLRRASCGSGRKERGAIVREQATPPEPPSPHTNSQATSQSTRSDPPAPSRHRARDARLPRVLPRQERPQLPPGGLPVRLRLLLQQAPHKLTARSPAEGACAGAAAGAGARCVREAGTRLRAGRLARGSRPHLLWRRRREHT